MKKVGKTTRPSRYDLNQIPYDYTVEVTNRFKGLDLIDRVPEELRMEVCDILQEMERVNINILRISELKWTGMGEFNSNYHYIYYCGQESLRRNGVAIIVNQKCLKFSTWMQSQKLQNDLFVSKANHSISKSKP